jgi:hypothetical protein
MYCSASCRVLPQLPEEERQHLLTQAHLHRREPPLHIDAVSGKPDRNRVGLRMRGRIEPVRHRQDLLRRTLQQGREPTGRSGLRVRLDDITSRHCHSRWTLTCRRSPCHAHHLLSLVIRRIIHVLFSAIGESICILGEETGKTRQHLPLFTAYFWWREAGESLDNVIQVL